MLTSCVFRVLVPRGRKWVCNPKNWRSFSNSSRHLSNSDRLTILSQENGVRNICLNDPKKRNALSLSMMRQLEEDLTTDEFQEDLRVIVLSHTGPVFSAGHDLKELTPKQGRTYHQKVFDTCSEVMNLIQDLPVPVIAKVNGLATAAGCQLVATCDIAIATESSRFATPGGNVGLFCSTPGVALGRSVPRKVALEMLFTGEPISAQDALLHGLVSRVVSEEELEKTVEDIAKRICGVSRSVTALGKATFYAQMSLERRKAYKLAGGVMVDNLSLDDGREGIRAFIDKRKPTWTHTMNLPE